MLWHMALIEVSHVTAHYGIKPVLQDISLSVEAGELIALMGPNGMGKSTLMAVMAGVLWPMSGQVTIDGKKRRASEEIELAIRKRVVYIPAEPWLPALRTGRQWLLATGRLYCVAEDRLLPHVDVLLEVFDLSEKADSLVSSYSTGQKKKIAVCSALVTDAPIMLLDEPFAGGLDPSAIFALKRILLHHRQRRDRTVIFATPVPELVEELADRVGVIANGKLLAFDTLGGFRNRDGVERTLEDAYQQAVNPRTIDKFNRYLEVAGS
jgi:ABC-type multidrug transport system ATPase subunit